MWPTEGGKNVEVHWQPRTNELLLPELITPLCVAQAVGSSMAGMNVALKAGSLQNNKVVFLIYYNWSSSSIYENKKS